MKFYSLFLALFFCLTALVPARAAALDLPDIGITDAIAGPSNFWECILDKVPGSSYGVEFRMREMECRQKFPYNEPLEKDTTFFFGLFTREKASECVEKYTQDTPNLKARNAIKEACLRLYPK